MAGKLLESLQTDLSTRVYRVANGFNEALYLTANEPSLGMYRLQEHIQLTIPKVVEQKQALAQVRSETNDTCCDGVFTTGYLIVQVCQRVEGVCYDLEYNVQAVQKMADIDQFSRINSLLAKAVELKAKLNQPENTSTDRRVPSSSSQTTPMMSTLSPQFSIQASTPSSVTVDDELKPKQFD